jgi:hypothetical protein
LWWVAHHRHHHRYSDTLKDLYFMKIYGFWYSHIGWIVGPDFKETDYKVIGDYAKYPELVWLNKHYLVAPTTLALGLMALGGWVNGGTVLAMFTTAGFSTLFIGFFLSTVILYHATFSINSIMHKFGKPRYATGDESKNNLWLALLTMGEGWHNNHHYYEVASRQGFFLVGDRYHLLHPQRSLCRGAHLGLKRRPRSHQIFNRSKECHRVAQESRSGRGEQIGGGCRPLLMCLSIFWRVPENCFVTTNHSVKRP